MTPRAARILAPAAAVLIGVPLALTACAPGGSSGGTDSSATTASSGASGAAKKDPASLGDVTLTVWDQEVRGGGNAQITELNKEFQAKYPNIKLARTTKSFDDLKKTVKLGLSGANAPDVVQINNTRGDMGAYVKAGQLLNLDGYAKAYGWDQRYPESVRAVASYSPDAKTFGSGSLYGLPQVGEVVGVFYNAKKLKTLGINPAMPTWADFGKALETAKSKGETPLMLGNVDKWPAGHVFGLVQGAHVPADQIRTLAFGNAGGSWKTPENKAAMDELVSWVDKGYFNNGFNGQGYDPAWQAFSKGTGVFLIGGTWLQADLSKAMGADVGFMLPPPAQAGGVSVETGASGQPWSITAKSKNADAAAAYIDFITTKDAMKVIASTENLPVIDTAAQKAPNPLAQQVFTAFDTATTKNGLVPYLDWATPTMGDTIGAALQDLMAKKQTTDQTLDTLEQDYSAFSAKNG